MSLLNGSANKAREVIDFCMANESLDLKAKVFEIISRSELEPNDPMFMALLLTGQMRVLIEAALKDLNRLLSEWKLESASSLSEISNAVSEMKKTQIEQAEAIKDDMEAVSNRCVSDIKEAGMGTVGAIADASSKNFERLQENKEQIKEVFKTLSTLQAEAKADREKNIENMNALIGWVNKTTKEFKLTNQQNIDSYSELRKLQQKTFWFKSISWYFPLIALFMMGGFSFLAGSWLTVQKYTTFEEQYGRNIFNWNKDRLIKCENDDNPKCTFWIVPPDSPERNE